MNASYTHAPSGGNNWRDMKNNEFWVNTINDGLTPNTRWQIVVDKNAPAHKMDVKVTGGVATFTFSDIELDNNFLSSRSTEKKKFTCSFSVKLAELTAVSTLNPVYINLVE